MFKMTSSAQQFLLDQVNITIAEDMSKAESPFPREAPLYSFHNQLVQKIK